MDARSRVCPMPTIRLGQAIRMVEVDQLWRGPTPKAQRQNIAAWCKDTSHELVEQSSDDSTFSMSPGAAMKPETMVAPDVQQLEHEVQPGGLALIVLKGLLHQAYPPLVMATTAARMGWEVGIFFTFYGLDIVHKERLPKLSVSPVGNAAMPPPLRRFRCTFRRSANFPRDEVGSHQDDEELGVEGQHGLDTRAARHSPRLGFDHVFQQHHPGRDGRCQGGPDRGS